MDPKKNTKIKGKKLNPPELSQFILKLYRAHPGKWYSARQVMDKLKVANSKIEVQQSLIKLAEKGLLMQDKDMKFGLSGNINNVVQAPGQTRLDDNQRNESRKLITGFIDMTRTGSAYILSKDTPDDVFVAPKNLKNALHGDTVRVRTWIPRGKSRLEGEVVEIVERATDFFIGTIRLSKKYAIVIPDRQNMLVDIFVDLEDTKNAKEGDKVIVKVIKWQSKLVKAPIGQVTTILGKGGSSDMEMKTILINSGFNIEFPEEVVAEADAISAEISTEEIGRRRDMRGILTITIDPFDAKDFDDAISFRVLENGHHEIGVHIADVSHYIMPNTPLDKEALRRSTSVYLPDRVCPMLPEKLSNVLCSLRPNEDKLTFSAIFEIDDKGKILERWFGKTVIHSNRRFTYEEAQDIIEGAEGDYSSEILTLDKIAKVLRKKRFKNGSIDFDKYSYRYLVLCKKTFLTMCEEGLYIA
jgi:ribonuclease R